MTYSFSARGDTKSEAVLDCDEKIDKLCHDMPIHEHEKEMLLASMRAAVNVLPDPDYSEVVVISMSGYISWMNDPATGGKRITNVSSSVSAGLGTKK